MGCGKGGGAWRCTPALRRSWFRKKPRVVVEELCEEHSGLEVFNFCPRLGGCTDDIVPLFDLVVGRCGFWGRCADFFPIKIRLVSGSLIYGFSMT